MYADKTFSFAVIVDSADESCWVKSIVVTRKKDGKQLQVLIPKENAQDGNLSGSGWFALKDTNVDGYNGVHLSQLIPAGPNASYTI